MPAALTAARPVRERIAEKMSPVWPWLDRAYLWCGYLAAFAMVAVFAVTMIQIAGRLAGFSIRGGTDIAGYFMAASAFLAFAHTFNRGAHIRIELFLSMTGALRPALELLSFAISTAVAAWFTWYSWSMVYWSWKLGDVSQGLDATPLWIPQLSMAIGMSLFAVSVADHGLRLALTGGHQLEPAPDAL